MNRVRARLVACVIAILACQAAALSAAPVALCRGALSADADLDECCKNLGPGQTCPMHRQTHDGSSPRGPAWSCPCGASNTVLASLVAVAGGLSAPIRLPSSFSGVTAVVVTSPSVHGRLEPPQSPPPRA